MQAFVDTNIESSLVLNAKLMLYVFKQAPSWSDRSSPAKRPRVEALLEKASSAPATDGWVKVADERGCAQWRKLRPVNLDSPWYDHSFCRENVAVGPTRNCGSNDIGAAHELRENGKIGIGAMIRVMSVAQCNIAMWQPLQFG